MFNRKSSNIQTINNDDSIIFAIVTNNLNKVKELINNNNVNKVIDNKNKYTSLHYAVTIANNDDVIKYLLDIGADPKIEQIYGINSYELSLQSNKKYIYEYYKIKQQLTIKNLEYENNTLKRKVSELSNTIEYYDKSIDGYNNKITNLTKENSRLKKDLTDAENAFENVLKKQKK